MAMRKFYHNKKRNPALLYEFLIRHISKCLIEDKKIEANKAVDISKKYFSKGRFLYDELKLFNSILDTKVKTRNSAQKIIESVCSSAIKTNSRNLDVEKSKLIKEINHAFSNETFYKHKIQNYTVYASIQGLLSESRNKRKTLNVVQKVKLEENISDYLVREPTEKKEILKTNLNYNETVYKFVVEKFHKKYEQKLNEQQKKLLTTYAVYLLNEDRNSIKKVVDTEINNIKNKLRTVKDKEVRQDSQLLTKINECYKKFVSVNFEEINEENILELLKYMQLIEEVESQ